jgi:hypothetical protein
MPGNLVKRALDSAKLVRPRPILISASGSDMASGHVLHRLHRYQCYAVTPEACEMAGYWHAFRDSALLGIPATRRQTFGEQSGHRSGMMVAYAICFSVSTSKNTWHRILALYS